MSNEEVGVKGDMLLHFNLHILFDHQSILCIPVLFLDYFNGLLAFLNI